MRPRLIPGTAAIALLGLAAALTISAPRLAGQTQPSGPFGYIHAADQAQTPSPSGLPNGPATNAQVLRGRYLVTSVSCTDCHSQGLDDPNEPNWLAGYVTGGTSGVFQIGPFKTYSKNLTPDV